jgi:hypothetical protein
MRNEWVGLVVAFLLVAAGCQTQRTNPVDRLFVNVNGDSSNPLRCGAGSIAALIFITTDCPIANGYAPQIQELIASYRGRPVTFHLVHVDPDLTRARARRHAKEYGYRCSVLLDPEHWLVARSGVGLTPEAAVFSSDGRLQYRGRINNWYGDIGRKRFRVSKHDLRNAIDDLLAGKPVAVPRTDAVGCEIEPITR